MSSHYLTLLLLLMLILVNKCFITEIMNCCRQKKESSGAGEAMGKGEEG